MSEAQKRGLSVPLLNRVSVHVFFSAYKGELRSPYEFVVKCDDSLHLKHLILVRVRVFCFGLVATALLASQKAVHRITPPCNNIFPCLFNISL